MQVVDRKKFFPKGLAFALLFISLFAVFLSTAKAQEAKQIKDMPQLKAFTRADMQIPEDAKSKILLSAKEVENLILKLNSYKSSLKGAVFNSSSTSEGELKDISHKGINNVMTLEFLKLQKKDSKYFLILEANSFKIGKMPFNAYSELQIPIEHIFKDESGTIYIDYAISKKLKEINFIKVMGAKARINQFSFKYNQTTNKAEFYIYSKDTITFMGDREMSLFGKGIIF